jgi:hypothetical protein
MRTKTAPAIQVAGAVFAEIVEIYL